MGAIFELKIHQNAFAAGVSSGTPLEILQRSPDPLAGFRGLRGRGGTKGKGRGREKEKEGKGVEKPLLSLQINDDTVIQVKTHLRRQVEDK